MLKCGCFIAPVAQLDRVLPSEGRSRTFESSRAPESKRHLRVAFVIFRFYYALLRSAMPEMALSLGRTCATYSGTQRFNSRRNIGIVRRAVFAGPAAMPSSRSASTSRAFATRNFGWGVGRVCSSCANNPRTVFLLVANP